MSLARKLALLVAVPLLAVAGYATFALYTSVGQAVSAARLADQVELAGTTGALARDLHRERLASVGLLGSGATERHRTEFGDLVARTDDTIADYHRQRAELSELPAKLAEVVGRIDAALDDLPGLRERVLSGADANLSAVTFRYRILAADIELYRETVATGAPVEVADQIRAAALLTRVTEANGLHQIAVLRATRDELTPATIERVRATRSATTQAARAFSEAAPEPWLVWYDAARVGRDSQFAQVMDDEVALAEPGDQLPVDASVWRTVLTTRVDALGEVESRVDGAVLESVVDYRNGQVRLAVIQGAVVLVTLIGAIGLAVGLGTPMIRGLRGLRTAARAVAFDRLPATVRELSRRNALGSTTPQEFAERAGAVVRVRGTDEIAQVGGAINELNYSAVHLAAQQAALRDQVDSIFVTLARRTERLTSAMITQVDRVEREENDPDRLAQLFVLDHLANRMRRTNNSLLVLGGEATARVNDEPMTCYDLLNAASAQVAQYARVDIRSEVDESGVDLTVATEVTDHLAHLLAELIDNATTFSPPESRVVVTARPAGDTVVVTIADTGIGLEPPALAAANARLATPMLDVSSVRAMGLSVVGHIASWYGVRVVLESATGRADTGHSTRGASGTVATVTLPATVFRRGDFDWFQRRESPNTAAIPTGSGDGAAGAGTAGTDGTDETSGAGTITVAAGMPAGPQPARAAGADQRDAVKISGVMSAFARGIGAHRGGDGPDPGDAKDDVDLVEHK